MSLKLSGAQAYLDPGLDLVVPGGDGVEREYRIPLASPEVGLWCRMMAVATGEITPASSEEEIRAAFARVQEVPQLPGDESLPERLLGLVYQQMVADRVPDVYVQFCTATVYAWIVGGDEAAERWWKSGGRRPEAPRPGNRADRRAASRGQTNTAAATTTPRPASTSGTRSRRTSSRRGRGRGSPGPTSSPTGT